MSGIDGLVSWGVVDRLQFHPLPAVMQAWKEKGQARNLPESHREGSAAKLSAAAFSQQLEGASDDLRFDCIRTPPIQGIFAAESAKLAAARSPRSRMEATAASRMNASITAYSTAVGPDSSARNERAL